MTFSIRTPQISPVLLGLSGPALTAPEIALIKKINPMGFLLFARNIETPEQTQKLCAQLAELSPLTPPLIAVDQEGGRVQRVHFEGRLPPAKAFGDWYETNPETAREACRLNHILLAAELTAVGAHWALTPVLDVAHAATHAIIGDRAFSSNPATVAALAQAALQGLREGGCFACLKHAPGHGRAAADSHVELPTVNASQADIEADAQPFKQLAPHAPFIMTAHIRYPALDPANCATNSKTILSHMRKNWQFDGLILADDLGMQALQGSYAQRAQNALAAGCDVVICSFSQLKAGMAGTVYNRADADALAAANLPPLNPRALQFLQNLPVPTPAGPQTIAEARAKLKALWADGAGRLGYTLAL
ncbi:MAG TPA: beta-N-acetylhexosaminidase [Alphaproteobacteria bacterium]|nr:beta-N-acetylhexosaminidase [Alphaproteobacteria bacterium]